MFQPRVLRHFGQPLPTLGLGPVFFELDRHARFLPTTHQRLRPTAQTRRCARQLVRRYGPEPSTSTIKSERENVADYSQTPSGLIVDTAYHSTIRLMCTPKSTENGTLPDMIRMKCHVRHGTASAADFADDWSFRVIRSVFVPGRRPALVATLCVGH